MKELYGVATVTAALIATIPLLGSSPNVVAAESAPPAGIKNVASHVAYMSHLTETAKLIEEDATSATVNQ